MISHVPRCRALVRASVLRRLGRAVVALAVATGCGQVVGTSPGDAGEPGDGSGDSTVRRGVDYSWARPSPEGLRAAGYGFAVRYLSHDTTGKTLSADEARALTAAGLEVVANWEDRGTDALLGRSRGADDAVEADRQAAVIGMPAGRPIYFAVDFDAAPDQQAAIDDYFDGVASVLGRDRTGAYGGFSPIQHLLDAGKITWAWQTYAWSGGRWDPRAQLRQVRNNVEVAGGACDLDEAHAADFGQWGAAAAIAGRWPP